MKKYNIAQFGTFDLENFGDLLFPDVLEKQLRSRLELDNLILFSPVGGIKPFTESTAVYPIADFEKLNEQYNFDAIILGGGDLIRLDETVASKDSYSADNASFELFVLPSIYAERFGIPLIYNAPGAPYPFAETQSKLIDAVIKCCGYLSMRDSKSAEIVIDGSKCETSAVTVVPDSVFSISELYDEALLSRSFKDFSDKYKITENNYIIFQCVSSVSPETEEAIAEGLRSVLRQTNVPVVFMPINYIHHDTPVMRSLFEKLNCEQTVFVEEHLCPLQMTALLSKSCGYLGSSLHGSVVSLAFGKKACSINLLNFTKLNGIFGDIGLQNNIITGADELPAKFFASEPLSKASLSEINEKISCHFDRICEYIKSPSALVRRGFAANIFSDYFHLLCEYSAVSAAPSVTVYFDRGSGFIEADAAVIKPISAEGRLYSFELRPPEGTLRMRLDPIEGCGCIMNMPLFKNATGTVSVKALNGIDCGGFCVFSTADPQLLLEASVYISRLEFSFEFLPLPLKDNNPFSACALSLCNTNTKTALERDELNQKYLTAIETEKHLSQYVDSLSDERDALKAELKALETKNELAIRKCENEKSCLATQARNSEAKAAALGASIAEIRGSFCWKITAPIRGASTIARKTLFGRFLISLKRKGIKETNRKIHEQFRIRRENKFVSQNNELSQNERKRQESFVFPKGVKFSILVPLYNTPENFLCEMIDSVLDQTYSDWELCLADGSDSKHSFVEKAVRRYVKKDKRIIYKRLEKNGGISENTNACIDMASGEYIVLFDHDDILHPTALFENMKVICESNADFIYSDEDKFSKLGHGFFEPHFKPDFAVDNLRANNYICHLTVFRASLLKTCGAFRKEFDGSQDHDLVLRLTEKAERIIHIPKILYHWRVSEASVASDPYAKPYTITAGISAVSGHLERCGLKASVESSAIHPNIYRIRYDIIGTPLVSILIPTKDHVSDLKKCIESIYEKTTYKHFEIIIIENNSTESETFEFYEELRAEHDNLRVVVWKNGFNYSAINNFGAKEAKGEHLLLLNNDVEIISPDWLQEMLMYSQRDDVGAVGAKLYYPDDTIQHAGVILGLLSLAGHAFRNAPRSTPGYFGRAAFQQNLSCCTAACLMIPKKVFEEVNGLDDGFAVAFNDVDLCMRIRQKGHLIVFTPYAELYHYESKSRGLEDTPEKIARFNGEIARFTERWGNELKKGDPYYNPNLTLQKEDFSLKC